MQRLKGELATVLIKNLLQSGKLAVEVTDHVPMPDPGSVHMLFTGAAGMRAPLHEYMKESPARNWSVRAVAGMVTALA